MAPRALHGQGTWRGLNVAAFAGCLLDPVCASEEAASFWASQELKDSLRHARTAFCIHNLAYQGAMPLAAFPRLCLPESALRPLLWPPTQSEGKLQNCTS